jgi:hypothetical protein
MARQARTACSLRSPVTDSAPNSSPKPGSPRSREEGALLLLLDIGAALLLASLFVGWYQVHEVNRFGCSGITESFSPFWVTVTTSGSDCPPSGAGTLQSAGLPQTGALYAAAGILTAIAGVLALAPIGLKEAGRRSRRVSIALLALSARVLAIGALAPALLVMEQTSTVCHDEGVSQTPFEVPLGGPSPGAVNIYLNQSPPAPPDLRNDWSFWTGSSPGSTWPVWFGASGPWNSFAGTNSSAGAALAWGPGFGLAIDLGGLALLAAGPVLVWKLKPPS